MAGTWSDSEVSSSDDEEEISNDKEAEEDSTKALLCLMPNDDVKIERASKEESTELVILDNSCQELHDTLEDLLLEYKTLA